MEADLDNLEKNLFEREMLDHLDGLYGYALHLCRDLEDASDLVQETYAKALKSSGQYTLGTNSRAWLFAIMRNTHLNEIRSRIRKPVGLAGEWIEELSRKDIPELHRYGPDPGVSFMDKLLRNDIEAALDSLPGTFREAVVLCDVQGMSYAEIASVLDIPIGTVRSRIHRGRMLLRHLLADWHRFSGGEGAE
jgi:RNA polymerase sigma-70 factor (ECF subfamily)